MNEVKAFEQKDQDLKDFQLDFTEIPEWMKAEEAKKRSVGRPHGSKNVTKHTENRLFIGINEAGNLYHEVKQVVVKKAESHIAMLYFKCGACFLDGFNMPICKRISNYKTMKYNDANPVCKHLKNCPSCELLKTFTLFHSYDQSQSLPVLRNDVAKRVSVFKENGQYPTMIN
jgi:hypothetical protein